MTTTITTTTTTTRQEGNKEDAAKIREREEGRTQQATSKRF
jgi:hypothetical protein